MKVWTDKSGRKLSAGEFFGRWKSGIEKVTPLQQTASSLFGYTIIFVGIVWGIIFTIKLKQWWLLTILCGSLIISAMQFLGTVQKYLILKRIANIQKEATDEI
jgi:hypothetical protein